jgi:hypothetical protein
VIHLGSIYECLKNAGYKMKGQYFIIDGIPVDFIPVYNDLSLAALANSVEKIYSKIPVKVFRPEYLLALALETGRPQDLRKIDLLLNESDLDKKLLNNILKRYGLSARWENYVKKYKK